VALDDASGAARGWAVLWTGCAFVGRETTNNVAEYAGLLLGLRAVLRVGVARAGARLFVQGDSELVVRQVVGDYDVRAEHLKPLRAEAAALVAELRARRVDVALSHVLRACNAEADRLSNVGLERDMSAPRADALARFGCWAPPDAGDAGDAPPAKRGRDEGEDGGWGAAKRARGAGEGEG
jgi:ribonuclease HI